MKTKGNYFEVGLISFLIFAFLSSPFMTSESGFNTALAAAQQTAGPAEGDQNERAVNDPYEHFNRQIFGFNDSLYFGVVKPVAQGYSALMPADLREAIRNGFHNLLFPSRFVNFILQAKWDKPGNETLRFIINSSMGMAGLLDLAQCGLALQSCESDFGQTLALWGVCPGPFLIIPVLGPSNPRDLFGFGVDTAMDPLVWAPATWWVTLSAETGRYVNRISLQIGQYEELKRASLDPYIAMRDAYIQYREHLMH
ncbi:VacJ family lipoprotein [Syntrophobacter sp. SbD2]|nr:VacJ family lipoprotein [Syntrophobacter sp. SbD2]